MNYNFLKWYSIFLLVHIFIVLNVKEAVEVHSVVVSLDP